MQDDAKQSVLAFLGAGVITAFGFAVGRTQESAAQAIVLMNGVFLGHNRMRCSWATQNQVPCPLVLLSHVD